MYKKIPVILKSYNRFFPNFVKCYNQNLLLGNIFKFSGFVFTLSQDSVIGYSHFNFAQCLDMEIAIYKNMTKPLVNRFKPCILSQRQHTVRSKPYFMYNGALAIWLHLSWPLPFQRRTKYYFLWQKPCASWTLLMWPRDPCRL